MRTTLSVDFKAIQTRCYQLNLAALNKADDVFRLVLQGLDALHESGEGNARVRALETNVAGQLAKIDALERHEQELLNKNQSLQHQTSCFQG